MFACVGQYEVVVGNASRAGVQYQAVRMRNGAYMIAVEGRLLRALYWRAGELDRCLRAIERLMGEELAGALAA